MNKETSPVNIIITKESMRRLTEVAKSTKQSWKFILSIMLDKEMEKDIPFGSVTKELCESVNFVNRTKIRLTLPVSLMQKLAKYNVTSCAGASWRSLFAARVEMELSESDPFSAGSINIHSQNNYGDVIFTKESQKIIDYMNRNRGPFYAESLYMLRREIGIDDSEIFIEAFKNCLKYKYVLPMEMGRKVIKYITQGKKDQAQAFKKSDYYQKYDKWKRKISYFKKSRKK